LRFNTGATNQQQCKEEANRPSTDDADAEYCDVVENAAFCGAKYAAVEEENTKFDTT